jgi:hypothetical protein
MKYILIITAIFVIGCTTEEPTPEVVEDVFRVDVESSGVVRRFNGGDWQYSNNTKDKFVVLENEQFVVEAKSSTPNWPKYFRVLITKNGDVVYYESKQEHYYSK